MLTAFLRELLCKADINRGVLNDVPLDTLSALANLHIVDEQCLDSNRVIVRGTTAGTASTHVDGVKLTTAGIQLACSIQGVDKVRLP